MRRETTPERDRYGGHVSERVVRAFADEFGEVLACPNCPATAGICSTTAGICSATAGIAEVARKRP